jgi:hypothetical protein
MENAEFEQIGFIKEYYIDNKFIGYVRIGDSQNRKIGYVGRESETIEELLILHNGKKIKPSTIVTTIIYPVNGAFKK